MIAPTTTRKAVADRMEVEADHRGGAQGVGEARRVMEMKSLTRRSCKGAAGKLQGRCKGTARALQEHCKGTLQASCPHFPLHSVSRPARLSVLCMVKGNTCQGEGGTSSVHSAEHKLLCTLLCYLLWYASAHMYWAYISTLLQRHISCDAWRCYATLFKYIIDIKRRHLLCSY